MATVGELAAVVGGMKKPAHLVILEEIERICDPKWLSRITAPQAFDHHRASIVVLLRVIERMIIPDTEKETLITKLAHLRDTLPLDELDRGVGHDLPESTKKKFSLAIRSVKI